MITIFFFIVFLARLFYLHFLKAQKSRSFSFRDYAAPLMITLVIFIPLGIANLFPKDARFLTNEEIINEYEDSHFEDDKFDAFKYVMKRDSVDIDLRFKFIDLADEFEHHFDDTDSVYKNFTYSTNKRLQRQSLAYLYASRYTEDSQFVAPIPNAPRTNYILGIRKLHEGKNEAALRYFWKELDQNPGYSRAVDEIFLIELTNGNLEELTNNEEFIQHTSPSQQRFYHFENRKWGYYLFDIVKAVFKVPMAMALFAGLVISILWLLFMRNLDIFRMEKWRDLIIVFLIGGFLTHFCWIGYDIARYQFEFGINGQGLNDFLYCVFVIGLSEEIVKFLPWIAFIFLAKKAKEPYDYILYACVSALGFAFVENLHYLENPGNISLRSIMSTVGHMFDASLVAYGFILGRYKAKNKTQKFLFPLLGFVAAIFAHGFYDFWLISPGYKNLSILTFVFFALTTAIWFQFINNAMNNSPYYVGRRFEPLRQINILSIGLVSIMIVEYLAINYHYGTSFANERMLTHNWMVPIFLLFTTVLIYEFQLAKGRWRKFQFRLADLLPIFSRLHGDDESFIEYRSFEGLELRLFVPKSNRYIGNQFPIRVRIVSSITVSGSADWSLCQITSSFQHSTFREDYVIIRTKDRQIPIDEDKVEILLLFVPHAVRLDGSDIETTDLRFTGKAFSRPIL